MELRSKYGFIEGNSSVNFISIALILRVDLIFKRDNRVHRIQCKLLAMNEL